MNVAKRLMVVAVLTVFAVMGVAMPVFSQEQEAGSGLSVSPTRTELTIEPGGEDVLRISLRNVTNNTIVARPVVNDFFSDNETGQPQLLINEERDVPSIKPFLKELEDVTLAQGAEATVEIPVTVPSDTAPGGYYGVVRYLAIPEGASAPDEGQVSLTASISSILLVEVPGDVREQVQLRNVLFYRQGVTGSFFTSKPEQVGVEIVNQGNGFIKPFGNVMVKNPFGKEVQSYEMNTGNPRNNVLPESTRVFKEDLSGISVPGRYTTTASVSFGNGGEVLTLTKTFWYLPIWFVIAVLVLIAGIVAAVFYARKRFANGGFKKNKK